MPVPPKAKLNRPILEIAAESAVTLTRKDFIAPLAERFSLTEDDLAETTHGANETRIANRINWGVTHLKYAGLLDSPSRGKLQINQAGREFLKAYPTGDIPDKLLRKLRNERDRQASLAEDAIVATSVPAADDSFVQYDETAADMEEIISTSTPDEVIADAYQQLQGKLADDMLDALKGVDPYRFERIVVALLVKMGYGDSERDDWDRHGGDGGIDGVINQDPLGLENVYIQAKRWQNTVGDPEIRNFSGSLMARGASKGVFITTSNFSGAARQTAQTISATSQLIRLINGQELARLMIQHGVGVVTENTYEVKKLDENYFSDSDDI